MTERTIIYRADPHSEAAAAISQRLRASGVNVIDEQADMLLVSGAETAINEIVSSTAGWGTTAEKSISLPDTTFSASRPPDD